MRGKEEEREALTPYRHVGNYFLLVSTREVCVSIYTNSLLHYNNNKNINV